MKCFSSLLFLMSGCIIISIQIYRNVILNEWRKEWYIWFTINFTYLYFLFYKCYFCDICEFCKTICIFLILIIIFLKYFWNIFRDFNCYSMDFISAYTSFFTNPIDPLIYYWNRFKDFIKDILIKTFYDNYNTNTSAIYSDFSPEIFLFTSLCVLIIFFVILDYKSNYKLNLTTITGKFLIFSLLLYLFILNSTLINSFLFINRVFINTSFNLFIKNIFIIALIFCILVSFSYIKAEKINNYEYYLLLGLSVIGMLTIISSNDLLTFYIGVEIQSLVFYILATIKLYNNFSTEAGLKYFILGAFSSGILLLGCSFVYGSLGTTNFITIMFLVKESFLIENINSLILGIILILISILFKLGAAPFHMWLPDVYEGVPTIVTMVYSIVPKIAILGLMVRLNLNIVQINAPFVTDIFMYSAILSIIIGTLGALKQIKIKRLLAYSAISHIGFILIGLATFTNLGLFSLFFYIIVYILISINIFTLLLVTRKVDTNLKIKKINEFTILFKSNPLLAWNFCLTLFSIAGIPPLIGFYSKLYIFISAIKSGYYLITIVASIFSVIACVYYIRLIKLMYFQQFEYWSQFFKIKKIEALIISFTFICNILFFAFPELIVTPLYGIIINLLY